MSPSRSASRCWLAAGALSSLLAVACSDPRNDELADAPDAAATTDGASPAQEGGLTPGTGGAAAPDAGTGGTPAGTGGSGGANGGDAGPDGPADAPAPGPADTPPEANSGVSSCPAGAVLCEDFETHSLRATWLGFADPGAGFSIDTTHAVRGVQSLRLHLDAGSKSPVGVHWTAAENGASIPNPAHLRFFLFLPNPTPAFVGAFATLDNHQNESVAVEWTDVTLDIDGNGDTVTTPAMRGGLLPQGRWLCVVMRVETGAASDLAVFLDDAGTPALQSSLTRPLVFDRVMFAISPDGSQTQAVDLFIDEVALAPTRLECQH